MNILFNINNKNILDIDTTILCTSDYTYNIDATLLINKDAVVITKLNNNDVTEIAEPTLNEFNCQYLKTKTEYTLIDSLKINILSNLNSNKNIFVFFNVLTYLDKEFKNKIIKHLKNNNKRIINYTTEIEETLLLDYIIVTNQKEIIMEGTKEQILKEEKILKKLGFNLPFIIELSNGLKYYNLIDKTYYTNEALVNELWK